MSRTSSSHQSVTTAPKVRCAIYCRKSSEEGLNLAFNSLDAQRESGESFIASQRGEGWVCLPDHYADGGFSGGNIERPALQRMLADIKAGKIDCVVVYKVDRLSRSLMDFARIMETFEKHKVIFSAVTQAFSTANSMGRLTLNVLLSFAQFERELVSERTRDKIAAARKKGKWAGGKPILGYDLEPATHRLIVNEAEAARVRTAFETYARTGSLIQSVRGLNAAGCKTKSCLTLSGKSWGGREWTKESLHRTLRNVLYRGQVRHFKDVYPGEHPAIIDQNLWDAVQAKMSKHGRDGGSAARNIHGALLKGLLHCKPCNRLMGHSFTAKKGGKLCYRYYVCHKAQSQGWDACPCRSVPAEQIEQLVVAQIQKLASDPVMLSTVLGKAREQVESKVTLLEGELTILERELRALNAEAAKASREGASMPRAALALSQVYEQITAKEHAAGELHRRIEAARADCVTKDEVDTYLAEFSKLWVELKPREQCEVLQLLMQRVDYDAVKGSVSMTFYPAGLRNLSGAFKKEQEAA